MMNTPLVLRHLFEYAQTYYPKKQIISRTQEGLFRYTYAEFGHRTRRLSAALAQLGVQPGDKVGTFAWNDHRHLEAYFAIPCMGAVLHTINIRLAPDQIAYIVNHAEDKVLLVDVGLLPLLEPIRNQLSSVRAFVILGDTVDVSASPLQPAFSYEALLADANHDFVYPTNLDENDPMGLCYTSGTTGNPRVSPTPTGAFTSTAWRWGWPTPPVCPRTTQCCRLFRCSTPTPGVCRLPPCGSAQTSFYQDRRRLRPFYST